MKTTNDKDTGIYQRILTAIISVFVQSAILMWGWNWLQPQLAPDLAQLGYWQAFVILYLCKLLFQTSPK